MSAQQGALAFLLLRPPWPSLVGRWPWVPPCSEGKEPGGTSGWGQSRSFLLVFSQFAVVFFLHLSSCASQSMASALAQGFDLHLRGFAAPGGAGWTFLLLEQLQARALQPASLLHGLLPRKELLAGA